MAESNKKNPGSNKPVRFRFSISWIYILLLIGIGYMFCNQGGANPQKEEWEQVKKQWLAGDIKEVVFIRNEFEGHITMKPDRIEKYSSEFGGTFLLNLLISFFLCREASMLKKCSVNSTLSYLRVKR